MMDAHLSLSVSAVHDNSLGNICDKQTKINERMTKIYDRFKAQEDCTEKRVEAEQQLEMETDARCAQEKEMKRVHVSKQIYRVHSDTTTSSTTKPRMEHGVQQQYTSPARARRCRCVQTNLFQCRSARLSGDSSRPTAPTSVALPRHYFFFVMTLQLLREQTQFLRQQERLRHRRLAEERREGLADAAEMKRSNREAYLQEKANQQRLRAEALRAQRYV